MTHSGLRACVYAGASGHSMKPRCITVCVRQPSSGSRARVASKFASSLKQQSTTLISKAGWESENGGQEVTKTEGMCCSLQHSIPTLALSLLYLAGQSRGEKNVQIKIQGKLEHYCDFLCFQS